MEYNYGPCLMTLPDCMGIGWYLVPVEFVHFDSNPQYQHPQCQSKTQLVPGWVNQTFFVRKKKTVSTRDILQNHHDIVCKAILILL